MPSNYTENYYLNQWKPEDQVRREDFNEDNVKIDEALSALAAADGVEAEARLALAAQVAKCGNCRVEAFTYVGTYNVNKPDNTARINFSGRPVFYMIFGDTLLIAGSARPNVIYGYCNGDGGFSAGQYIAASWSGNTLLLTGGKSALMPYWEGKAYFVVALYAQDA